MLIRSISKTVLFSYKPRIVCTAIGLLCRSKRYEQMESGKRSTKIQILGTDYLMTIEYAPYKTSIAINLAIHRVEKKAIASNEDALNIIDGFLVILHTLLEKNEDFV